MTTGICDGNYGMDRRPNGRDSSRNWPAKFFKTISVLATNLPAQ